LNAALDRAAELIIGVAALFFDLGDFYCDLLGSFSPPQHNRLWNDFAIQDQRS
jgi:hypothetical protein